MAEQRLVKQRNAECHPYHTPTNPVENYFGSSASEPASSSPQLVRTLRDRRRNLRRMRLANAKGTSGGYEFSSLTRLLFTANVKSYHDPLWKSCRCAEIDYTELRVADVM